MVRLVTFSIIFFLIGVMSGEYIFDNQTDTDEFLIAEAATGNFAPFDANLPASNHSEPGQTIADTTENIQSPTPNPAPDEIAQTWQKLVSQSRYEIVNEAVGPSTDQQIQRLIEAGISLRDASWVMGLTERLEQVQSGSANSRAINFSQLWVNLQREFRNRLGDTNYEIYLETLGMPTAVPVPGVAMGSAAAQAGLEPGDQIVRYNNQRVFSLSDLRTESVSGTEGQPIRLEIVRDGIPLTLTIERGQLGITRGNNAQMPIL